MPITSLWKKAFFDSALHETHSVELKDAALKQDKKSWTSALTFVVADSCLKLNWKAASKGNLFTYLPEKRNEYLGIDVMGFLKNETCWQFPCAAFELENSAKEDRIAYSLWKVLSLRVNLRVVFCYRPQIEQGPELVKYLCNSVVKLIDVKEATQIGGDTLLSIGYKNNAETFPYGFFRWWKLNKNTRTFDIYN